MQIKRSRPSASLHQSGRHRCLAIPLAVKELGFDPVMVPVLDSAYVEQVLFHDEPLAPDRDANVSWQLLWPLVVKPCPHLMTDVVRAALQHVAAAAASLPGHYRYHGYVDAFIAEDLAKKGPLMTEVELPQATDPCQTTRWDRTLGMVCSTFAWEAVREANRRAGPQIRLTLPIDRPAATHQCKSFYDAPAGDHPNPNLDGLFDYSEHEVQRAALSFAASIEQNIEEQASTMPWWASPVESLYTLFSDIKSDVANQICNAFAFDRCSHTEKDNDDWLTNTPKATSVSPDNIIRSWAAPLENIISDAQSGLYGYNEQLILRPGHFQTGQPLTVWGFSPGPGTVFGRVTYRGASVHGARVAVCCRTTHTDREGMYRMEVPSGRYLASAGAYLPQPDPQPAWYIEGEAVVAVPFNGNALGDIKLLDPPGENRQILVTGRADVVNRHVFGHDWWAHPKITCPIVHLGNYNTDEGEENGTGWSYVIDSGWQTGFSMTVTRLDQSQSSPNDPFPVVVHIDWMLGSNGAGWPFNPEASAASDFQVPTDGSVSVSADLKVGALAPVRAHIELEVFNLRQG
jgi:hypothetical protein